MHVRRAVSGDEPTLRALRLAATTDSPDAFGSTYERELARTADEWRRWIEPHPTFVLELNDGTAVGIVATATDEPDNSVIQLLAMWVHPSARGLGGGDLLVQAVVSWAESKHAASTNLWVTEGNSAALGLYGRHGFIFTGQQKLRERDGRTDLEMLCRL